MNNQSIQTTIYIGLSDSETGIQEHLSDKYLSILKNACRSYHIPFSVELINGGYISEDGSFIEENSLILRIIDVPEEITTELAKDLCVFFIRRVLWSHHHRSRWSL